MSTRTRRIGITGHINLSPETETLVADAIRDLLSDTDPADLIGVSCLAPGSDTIFAEIVVERGGRLEAIVPAGDYRTAQLDPNERVRFDRLVAAADDVEWMPCPTSSRASYIAANEELLARVDELIAVWDGQPSEQPGSTGSVVVRATCPITRVWPAGAERR